MCKFVHVQHYLGVDIMVGLRELCVMLVVVLNVVVGAQPKFPNLDIHSYLPESDQQTLAGSFCTNWQYPVVVLFGACLSARRGQVGGYHRG